MKQRLHINSQKSLWCSRFIGDVRGRSLAKKLPFDAMNAVLWPLPAYIPNQASNTSVAA